MSVWSPGKLQVEGKTKKVWGAADSPGDVYLESKDDITAGDGAKHDSFSGKGELSTQTTCNVFALLKACGLPVAFHEQVAATCFRAFGCSMIPWEVIVRREAHGSYLKRYPECKKGQVFSQLILEFFLKTSDKKWRGIEVPKDDPFILFEDKKACLYVSNEPIRQQESFATLEASMFEPYGSRQEEIGEIALKTFLVLEKAWQLQGRTLVDFKVEFGLDSRGTLRLADVIDNDSWRLLKDRRYVDKQVYREGGDLETVAENYREVANLTAGFHLPRQRVIIWRASEKDDLAAFDKALENSGALGAFEIMSVNRSAHKEPIQCCLEVAKLIQEVPDSVIIAYVGRSNGLGPTLSTQVTVPVITVPATWKDFPEDIWSSLRTASDSPAMTVIDPANAVLAALQILAMRNPRLYATLRLAQEERLTNIIQF